MNKQNSEYCKSEYKDIIETAGQSDMFEYIFTTSDEIEIDTIKKLHKMLYKYSMFPELAGEYRNTNNVVTKSKLETCDYNRIYIEMYKVNQDIAWLMKEIEPLSNSEFLEKTIQIHHMITVIYPFSDGNGRVSRAFLNWLLYLKGMYPIYLKAEYKNVYYDALVCADENYDYGPLIELFIKQIFNSDTILNERPF